MSDKKYDLTNFYYIIVPLMIMSILLFGIWMLFTLPDWVFGIPKLYPPYPGVGDNLTQNVTNALKFIQSSVK
jgi:hypothetical protein